MVRSDFGKMYSGNTASIKSAKWAGLGILARKWAVPEK